MARPPPTCFPTPSAKTTAAPPLISVVTPFRNAAPHVGAAVASILAQTHARFELIAVDDSSTDASTAIVEGFADPRVRVIQMDAPRGAGAARNVGVAAAQGDWIAFLDADDIAVPGRLELQLDVMRARELDVCGGCAKEFGAGRRIVWCAERNATIVSDLVFRCALMPSAVMTRADVARAEPFDETSLAEDYELWTRLALRYRLGGIQQILFAYRRHADQRHVSAGAAHSVEMRRIRRAYVERLFPGAGAELQTAVDGAVEGAPAQTLEALEAVGALLTRLADGAEPFFQAFLARRWRRTCRLAAPLGLTALGCYRRHAPALSDAAPLQPLRLASACLLRLPA